MDVKQRIIIFMLIMFIVVAITAIGVYLEHSEDKSMKELLYYVAIIITFLSGLLLGLELG